ncbi:MAG: hypothetical protein BroJett013_11950 [Alphaproteobacteria bacterium]|nr:MAG: hypothetical protein BroJett013_11950 [Alphaproteobacteria bacterium]
MSARRSLAELLGDAPANSNEPNEVEATWEIVRRWNKRFAFIPGVGVLMQDGAGGFKILSVRQFHDYSANKGEWTKNASGADKFTPYSQIWMQSEQRREYESIVFDPTDESRGCYNLWRGFTKHARGPETCDRFLDHLFENIARGNEAHYDWILGWTAHMIQRPGEKPGTALVLKGAPGVGKSTYGEHVGALFAPHYAKVSTPRGLSGQFNAHLAAALLVHLEESFWSGDKIAENDLKEKITGPTFNLEKKGHDVIQLKSHHRYLITSNERWSVPARHDERRYGVFHVGEGRQKDGVYFAKMAREMTAGGYRDLLRCLEDVDLSRVDVRTIPQTKALAAEKITGLRGVAAWWHEVLSEGELPCEGDWSAGGVKVRTDTLLRHCEEWMRGRRFHGDVPTADAFGRELKEHCPSSERTNPLRIDGDRVRFYRFPSLPQCRAEFEQWLDSKVEWPD